MFRKLLRYLMRRAIARELAAAEADRQTAYTLGGLDGYSRGHDDATSDVERDLGKAYLAGITDGVYLALQEPGECPKMSNKPENALVTNQEFFEAIDRADHLRRIPRRR